MKRIRYMLAIAMMAVAGFAQTATDNNVVAKIEATKSGNYKDVLAGFLQLATKNLSEDQKTLEFNGTLFAIKSAFRPELLLDRNIKEAHFSRNFQFNLKLDLDNSYRYQGFTGGITYALINGRDKNLAVFTNTVYGKEYEKFRTLMAKIQTGLIFEIDPSLSDEERSAQENLIEEAVEGFENNRISEIESNPYREKIALQYQEMVKDDSNISQKTIDQAVKKLDEQEKSAYQEIEAKPLLTVSADGSASQAGNFNRGSFKTVFLKGNKEGWEEIDLRAQLSYADTLSLPDTPLFRLAAATAGNPNSATKTRSMFKATAGINFKIGKNAGEESLFEIKAAAEYNAVLKNKLESEKKETFTANAELRLRIAKDFWIPLTVKYDVENENFLGFLNVSYNFGG